jgi:hypothetical protein
MNSDASLKFGCKENVSDMGNSLRDENIKYTPNLKRRKLRHSAPPAEHHSMVVSTICKNHPQVLPHENFEECYGDMQGTQFIQQQEYLMGGIPQVCTNENCKKRSPKCLSRRVSFCSTTSGELHISIDTSSLAEGNDVASNENTTAGVVCTYIGVFCSCDTNDACKVFGLLWIPHSELFMYCSSQRSLNYQFLAIPVPSE